MRFTNAFMSLEERFMTCSPSARCFCFWFLDRFTPSTDEFKAVISSARMWRFPPTPVTESFKPVQSRVQGIHFLFKCFRQIEIAFIIVVVL